MRLFSNGFYSVENLTGGNSQPFKFNPELRGGKGIGSRTGFTPVAQRTTRAKSFQLQPRSRTGKIPVPLPSANACFGVRVQNKNAGQTIFLKHIPFEVVFIWNKHEHWVKPSS
jgi:hypothetical protein